MRELVGWEGRNEDVVGRDICFTDITVGTPYKLRPYEAMKPYDAL